MFVLVAIMGIGLPGPGEVSLIAPETARQKATAPSAVIPSWRP
jgi:hypothetical protein